MEQSESLLEKACTALEADPADYTTALRHAQAARIACALVFPDGALKQLYLGLRWEDAARQALGVREWGRALAAVSTACEAYRLAQHRGEAREREREDDGGWVAGAAARGLQRCMAVGLQILSEG